MATGLGPRINEAMLTGDRRPSSTAVIEWIERYLQIEVVLDLDSSQWHCPVPSPIKLQTVGEAEQLAADVRSAWRLGSDPIPNMTELLEEKGLKVLICSLPMRTPGVVRGLRKPTNADQSRGGR